MQAVSTSSGFLAIKANSLSKNVCPFSATAASKTNFPLSVGPVCQAVQVASCLFPWQFYCCYCCFKREAPVAEAGLELLIFLRPQFRTSTPSPLFFFKWEYFESFVWWLLLRKRVGQWLSSERTWGQAAVQLVLRGQKPVCFFSDNYFVWPMLR